MTAREYLEQLPDMQVRINAIEFQISECLERATKTTSNISDSISHSGGASSDKVSSNVNQKIDYENELRMLKEEFNAFKLRAMFEINKVKDNTCAGLLINKYINGFSWERTAQEIHMDVDYR